MRILWDADKGGAGGGGSEEPSTEDKGKTQIQTPEQVNQSDVPGSWDEIFQHPRFKALNDRATAAEASLKERDQAKTEAEKKALEDQNKFKELYEKEVEAHGETKGTLASRDHEALRLKIGSELGLSPELASRLVGEDEETVRQDGERLAEAMGIEQDEEAKRLRQVKGIPPANRRKSSKEVFDLNDMTPEQIREKRNEIWEAGQEDRVIS